MSQIRLEPFPESQRNEPLLEASNLKVFFSQGRGFFTRHANIIKAVNDVSFSIGSSEVLCLVGESGSGKTTIGRCIAALAPINSGSVRFEGKDVTKLRGKSLLEYRRKVQMIFQDPYASLNPRRNVFKTISIPIRRLNREKDEAKIMGQVESLLVEVGLSPEAMLNKLPHQLSGGERQRVNIARGLASNPKLLVADEPTSMLDASQRLNVLLLLEQLRKTRNLSILLITHDLASAKRIGGRTAILFKGKMMELGPTNSLLSLPHHPYTELLLEASPKVELSKDRYNEPMQASKRDETPETGCIFRLRCKYATEICKQEEPKLLPSSRGSWVACHNSLNKNQQ